MEITSFKVKTRILLVLTFVHSKFNIWSSVDIQLMQTQLFWIPDSNAYKRSKFQPQTMSYEGDIILQR